MKVGVVQQTQGDTAVAVQAMRQLKTSAPGTRKLNSTSSATLVVVGTLHRWSIGLKSDMLGRLEVCSVWSLGWALTQLGAGNALYCIAQRFVELTQSFEPETADSNEAVKKLLTNLTPSAADVIEADYNEYLHRGSWRGFTTGCNCEQE